MTTFGRLPFAVSVSRLLFLILAVSSLAAEVRAQSTVRVGYYDMFGGEGAAEQVPPIAAAGFAPVKLFNVAAPDLAGIHVLFVQNPHNTVYGAEYLASRAAIQTAVSAGMVLVIHDRAVGIATTRLILPVPVGSPMVQGTSVATGPTSTNIDVSDPNTLVASGPGGMVTNTNVDGGNPSNRGWVNLLSVPATGRKGLLHTGTSATNQSVTFSYQFGLGFVIYSTIPLDGYLKGTGNNPPRDNLNNIYAPNVLVYAGCSLRPSQPTVSVTAATGYYGGTATLVARLHCGSLNLAGLTVDFSLNGTSVGSAQTDASGMATLTSASLGATRDSAIGAGTYAVGASASFAGAGLFTASSGAATLTVDKAPATIDVVGGTFVYDGTPHEATGSVTGVFDEPLGTPAFTYTDANGVTGDTAPVDAGTYAITATSTETANYLSTTNGSLKITIGKATPTVVVPDTTFTYNGAPHGATGTVTGVGGADLGALSFAYTPGPGAPTSAGPYAVLGSYAESANYVAASDTATLTIEKATPTVVVPQSTFTYDGAPHGATGTVTGVGGADLGALSFTYAPGPGAPTNAGPYAVLGSYAGSANYAAASDTATLTITPAALMVTANDKERLVGKPNPALTVTYAGLMNGDTPASLDVQPTVTTAAVPGSPAGTYPIVVSGALDPNYTIKHVNGTLTVSPEGRMHGEGFIVAGGARNHFTFDVRERVGPGERGFVTLRIDRARPGADDDDDSDDDNRRNGRGGEPRDDRFVSHVVTSVTFSDNPGFAPGRGRDGPQVDTVSFTGVGMWNGVSATFEAIASDMGEPGRARDTFSITIHVGGKKVAGVQGSLDSGNVQSNRLPGGSR